MSCVHVCSCSRGGQPAARTTSRGAARTCLKRFSVRRQPFNDVHNHFPSCVVSSSLLAALRAAVSLIYRIPLFCSRAATKIYHPRAIQCNKLTLHTTRAPDTYGGFYNSARFCRYTYCYFVFIAPVKSRARACVVYLSLVINNSRPVPHTTVSLNI